MEQQNKYRNNRFDFDDFKQKAIDKLKSGVPLSGKEDTLSPLLRRLTNRAIQRTREFIAMDDYDIEVETAKNFSLKNEAQINEINLRNSSDVSRCIKKLYEDGMKNEEIKQFLMNSYQLEVSMSLIQSITGEILPAEIRGWMNRRLEKKYVIVWLFSGRINTGNENEMIRFAIGLDYDGFRNILGIYNGTGESIIEDLYERGVSEVPVFCIDQPAVYFESISRIYQGSDIQRCLIHQMLELMKLISSRDRRLFYHGLQQVFRADNDKTALERFCVLEQTWGGTYPHVFMALKKDWKETAGIFRFPELLRKVMRASGIIEVLHRQLRKKIIFEIDQYGKGSVLKKTYSAIYYTIHKPKKQSLHNWGLTLAQLEYFLVGKLKKI